MNSPAKYIVAFMLLSGCISSMQSQDKSVDRSTLSGKVMCGYQGWFAVPSDSINRGWYHYQKSGSFKPGSCSIDLWPDLADADADEKYQTSFLNTDNSAAFVFSSQNRKTVLRHFNWMQHYGIDGVFVQRFVTETMNSAGLKQFNNVLESCRAGAQQYGRIFAVMYDLSGLQANQMQSVMNDWKTLIDQKHITADSAYLFHKGKPVVAIWGIGFNDSRKYTLTECGTLIDFFKNDPIYGGMTVMVGVPTYWQTLTGDAVKDTALLTIIRKADIVSPWFVGRPAVPDDATNLAKNVLTPNLAWCKQYGKEYLPVVFPGFSWYNMNAGKLNQIPRLKGKFLWRQYYEYIKAGATMLYQAMFDEMDEGTAVFKCTNNPPVGSSLFVTYENLPSDYYLSLVGQGAKMLRGERPLNDTILVSSVKPSGLSGTSRNFSLEQNYPNPFNPSTSIGFELMSQDHVTLKVFNTLGSEVAVLVNENTSPGRHQVKFHAADFPSGLYYYTMQAGNSFSSKKMLLLK